MLETKTFGQRCAATLHNRKIIIPEDIEETAKLIDFERAEVIRRASSATTPASIDHSDPRLAGVKTEEEFGDRKKIPPTAEQVAKYSSHLGTEIDGNAFCDFYESKGWVIGRTKMKDWQASTRRAIKEGYFKLTKSKPNGSSPGSGPRKIY